MNINMNFATRAVAALSLGTLLATTACTDYAQEFKDDENNKIYAEENPENGSSSSEFQTPTFDIERGEDELVVWQGYDKGTISNTTGTGEEIYLIYSDLEGDEDDCCIGQKWLVFNGSSIDSVENQALGTAFDSPTLFSEQEMAPRIRYYGGLGGKLSTDENSSIKGNLYWVFPVRDWDLSSYNMIRVTGASELVFEPQMAKIDDDGNIIEMSGDNAFDIVKNVTTIYTEIYVVNESGFRLAASEDMAKYNAVVIKLDYIETLENSGAENPYYNIIAISLGFDADIAERAEEEYAASLTKNSCTETKKNNGECFHWNGSVKEYRILFGDSFGDEKEEGGYWYGYDDNIVMGHSKIDWPVPLGNAYDAYVLDPVIDRCDGVCGSFELNKGPAIVYPYVGIGFNILGGNNNDEVADVSAWGGLCVVYTSSTPITMKLQPNAQTSEFAEYIVPMATLPQSTAPATVNLGWDEFTQSTLSGQEVAEKLSGVKLEFAGDDGTTGEFNIMEIGSLGTCTKY